MIEFEPSRDELQVGLNSFTYTTSKGNPIALDKEQKRLVDIATLKLFEQQSTSFVSKGFVKKAIKRNEAYIILKPQERRILDDLVNQISFRTLTNAKQLDQAIIESKKKQFDQAIIDAKEKQKQKTFVNRLKSGLKSLASKFSYTNLRSTSRSTSISSGRSSSGESR